MHTDAPPPLLFLYTPMHTKSRALPCARTHIRTHTRTPKHIRLHTQTGTQARKHAHTRPQARTPADTGAHLYTYTTSHTLKRTPIPTHNLLCSPTYAKATRTHMISLSLSLSFSSSLSHSREGGEDEHTKPKTIDAIFPLTLSLCLLLSRPVDLFLPLSDCNTNSNNPPTRKHVR